MLSHRIHFAVGIYANSAAQKEVAANFCICHSYWSILLFTRKRMSEQCQFEKVEAFYCVCLIIDRCRCLCVCARQKAAFSISSNRMQSFKLVQGCTSRNPIENYANSANAIKSFSKPSWLDKRMKIFTFLMKFILLFFHSPNNHGLFSFTMFSYFSVTTILFRFVLFFVFVFSIASINLIIMFVG